MTYLFFRRYLFSKRAGALIRTIAWICFFGVALGVLSLIIVISVMNGFNGTIRQRLLAIEPHLVIEWPRSSHESPQLAREKLLSLKNEFDQVKEIKSVLVESQDVILKTLEGTFGGAIAKGMNSASLGDLLNSINQSSRSHSSSPKRSWNLSPKNNNSEIILNFNKEEQKAEQREDEREKERIRLIAQLEPKEVILGADLAHSLHILEGDQIMLIPPETLLKPADEIPVYDLVTVKALFSSRVADVDSKWLFYRPRNIRKGASSTPGSYEMSLELRFPHPEDFSLYTDDLQKRGFKVQSWIDRNKSLFFALKMEKLAMTVFLVLSACITCFSIVTVLTLLLTQKRRDMGILMTMGLSQKKTRKLFIRIGMILSLGGMLSGLIIGLLVCLLLYLYPIDLLPDIYYDSSLPVVVSRFSVFIIVICAIFVAFISSYLPVKAQTALWPSQALRRGRK